MSNAVLGILAILAGMGGPRQIIILYLPLLLAAAACALLNWRRQTDNYKIYAKKYCGSIILAFVMSVLGYRLNIKILSKIYHFMSWDSFSYKDFSMDSLINIINGFFDFFGYSRGEVFSYATLFNGMCLVLLMLLFYSLYKGSHILIDIIYQY